VSEPDRPAQGDSAGSGESTVEPFAVLLRRLIDLKRHADARPYTVADVADELSRTQYKISKSHLYGLVNGTSKPSLEVTQGLADFFGVELEYFGSGARARALQDQYELLARLADRGVRDVAFRASELSGEQLRSVLDYIEFQASRSAGQNHTSG